MKARKGTRHWTGGEPGTKAIDSVAVVNPEQWADDLADSMTDLLRTIAEKEALKAARALDKAGVIDKVIADGDGFPNARTHLERLIGGRGSNRDSILGRPVEDVRNMIRESALRQSQKLADTIKEMDEAGASIDDIRKEVSKKIGSRSSWRKGLAVHAATSVMEGARNRVYARGGKYVKRKWNTVNDERVRPSHRKAEGQVRDATTPFRVGGALLRYPGDPTAPIEETANCRCHVEPVIDLGA